jgi:hypothetical protein
MQSSIIRIEQPESFNVSQMPDLKVPVKIKIPVQEERRVDIKAQLNK